jgi:hypothetical protein
MIDEGRKNHGPNQTHLQSPDTSKISNHHSTIINQNQPHLIFLLSTLCHLLSGASGFPPSGLKPNSHKQALGFRL